MDKKLFALLSGCLLSGIAEAGQTKPNVIIIYTDDHGTLDANCFGAPDLCTPNIDALATYGVRFTQLCSAGKFRFACLSAHRTICQTDRADGKCRMDRTST